MRACFCCHCQIADMKSCLHKQRLQMHADTSIRLIRPNESYMRWVRLGKTSIMCKLCNSAGIPPPCCVVLHCPASKPCTDGAQSQGLTHTAPCCPQVLLSSPLLMQSPTKLKSHCLIGRLHNDTSWRNKGLASLHHAPVKAATTIACCTTQEKQCGCCMMNAARLFHGIAESHSQCHNTLQTVVTDQYPVQHPKPGVCNVPVAKAKGEHDSPGCHMASMSVLL